MIKKTTTGRWQATVDNDAGAARARIFMTRKRAARWVAEQGDR